MFWILCYFFKDSTLTVTVALIRARTITITSTPDRYHYQCPYCYSYQVNPVLVRVKLKGIQKVSIVNKIMRL